jgi:hypothetical protein
MDEYLVRSMLFDLNILARTPLALLNTASAY